MSTGGPATTGFPVAADDEAEETHKFGTSPWLKPGGSESLTPLLSAAVAAAVVGL